MSDSPRPPLPSGLVAFVKRDCPTCELVVPVLERLAGDGALTIYCQDDPSFPEGAGAVDDRTLERSWHHAIETVPTLLAVEEGIERARTEGWDRDEWDVSLADGGVYRIFLDRQTDRWFVDAMVD